MDSTSKLKIMGLKDIDECLEKCFTHMIHIHSNTPGFPNEKEMGKRGFLIDRAINRIISASDDIKEAMDDSI